MERAKVMTEKLPLANREGGFESMLTENTQVEMKRKVARNELELTESVCSFQQLPTDIRLKIWNLALPGPRLVEMVSHPPPRMNSNRSTPSVLHVCSESRKEALKSYTAFPLGLGHDPSRVVYVDFQIDTLYFRVGPNGLLPKVLQGGYGLEIEHLMNKVRFVAIKHDAGEATEGEDSQAMPFLQRFGKLENLTLVVSDVGLVEITDVYELDVWDEWQIDESNYNFGCNVWDKFAVIFRRSKYRTGETDHLEFDVISRRCKMRVLETHRGILTLMKRAVMTRDCLGLKNVQARIVTIERVVKAS